MCPRIKHPKWFCLRLLEEVEGKRVWSRLLSLKVLHQWDGRALAGWGTEK